MGMYDHFHCDFHCPICGKYIGHDFQTKDLECLLDIYEPGNKVHTRCDSINVYTSCSHLIELDRIDNEMVFLKNYCAWIDINIPISNGGEIERDQNKWEVTVINDKSNYNNSLTFIPEIMRGCSESDVKSLINYTNSKIHTDILIMEKEKILKIQ